MKRATILAYGVFAYLLFFAVILYAMGFVGNVLVPKSIDSGEAASPIFAVMLNSLMLGTFAVQHTVMARKGFKQWITGHIPAAVERSTFVLLASAILAVTFWQWQPLPGVVWEVKNPIGATVLTAGHWFGWFLVFFATFLINHFDLFGLRQVWLAWRKQEYRPLLFRRTALYKLVRHPLLLGFLVAFWSAPVMTQGRLLFAALTTAYILVGIQFEERDLAATHGEEYRHYQQDVPMLIPYRAPRSGDMQTLVVSAPSRTAE